ARRHARVDGRRRVARVPRGSRAARREGAGGLTMPRTPLLAGNWKMHGTRAEATALAGALAASVGQVADREMLIAPPYTALDAARDAIAGTRILLGAQNVHAEDKGAFTGEVSAAMLLEAGCTHVIIGHSERRQFYGETDVSVNARLRGALRAG